MNAKNRNILYGYKFDNGKIAVDKHEAKIVNQVFTEYVKGLSLLKIANLLNQKGIEYLPNQVNWNKGKIKRIIEDKRYLGDDKYQRLLKRIYLFRRTVQRQSVTQPKTRSVQAIYTN